MSNYDSHEFSSFQCLKIHENNHSLNYVKLSKQMIQSLGDGGSINYDDQSEK